MRRLMTMAVGVVLALGSIPAAAGQLPEGRAGPSAEFQASTGELTRDLEQRIARLQATGGPAFAAEADGLRVKLAMIRHDFALARGETEVMLEQMRVIAQVRRRELTRALDLQQRGISSGGHVDSARCRFANALYRLALENRQPEEAAAQLRLIIGSCERNLTRLQALYERGAALRIEVNAARWSLACAQYHQTKLEGSRTEVVDHLRRMVRFGEEIVRDFERWVRGGMLPGLTTGAVEEVRIGLLEVRLRLAVYEDNPSEAIALLGQMLTLRETLLHYPVTDANVLAERQWAAVHMRHRLAIAPVDLQAVISEPLGELDY